MERALHIVVLDRSSVGEDVSVEPLKKYGEVTFHMTTKDEEAAERVKDADIIIVSLQPALIMWIWITAEKGESR